MSAGGLNLAKANGSAFLNDSEADLLHRSPGPKSEGVHYHDKQTYESQIPPEVESAQLRKFLIPTP